MFIGRFGCAYLKNMPHKRYPPEKKIEEDLPQESSQEAPADPVDAISATVQTIADLHARSEGRVSTHQRLIERVTGSLGRPLFVYLSIAFMSVWIIVNLILKFHFGKTFDEPPFFWLQGIASTLASFTALTVLATQNRQGRINERREQLDLQISLLVEHKVAKLISLVEELRRDLPNVQDRDDPEARNMMEAADPHRVVKELNRVLQESVLHADEIAARDEEEAREADSEAKV